MARFPGTERPVNRAGWCPGAAVRCRRSRANGARGLADRRGFVTEVRRGHVAVLLGLAEGQVWLESDAVLPADEAGAADLERLRRCVVAVSGQRVELEQDAFVIFGESFPASAVDEIRSLLGDLLVGYEIGPHGVHEIATTLRLGPSAR